MRATSTVLFFHYMMMMLKKILENRADYNNRPPNSISFTPAVASAPGRLQLVRILFLQAHQEINLFLQLQELIMRNTTRTSSVS